jgi:hypothetical protein
VIAGNISNPTFKDDFGITLELPAVCGPAGGLSDSEAFERASRLVAAATRML